MNRRTILRMTSILTVCLGCLPSAILAEGQPAKTQKSSDSGDIIGFTVKGPVKTSSRKSQGTAIGHVPRAHGQFSDYGTVTGFAGFGPATGGGAGGTGFLIDAGHTRKIGVVASPADAVLRAHLPQTKGKYGLVVTSVVKDSPAAKAGIQPRDILLTINGKELQKVSELVVETQKAKDAAKATILRHGMMSAITIRVPPARKAKPNQLNVKYLWTNSNASKYMIGVQLGTAHSSLLAQLNLPQKSGVIVRSVDTNSVAGKAGLRKYDVILAAGNTYLLSTSDYYKALDKSAGKPITLHIIRGGKRSTTTVTPVPRPKRQTWIFNVADLELHGMGSGSYGLSGLAGGSGGMGMGIARQPSRSLRSQVDRLTEQVDRLRKTLEELKKTLPADKPKKK